MSYLFISIIYHLYYIYYLVDYIELIIISIRFHFSKDKFHLIINISCVEITYLNVTINMMD